MFASWKAWLRRLEIPLDKFFCNLDRHGNTSAASIPIAFDEACHKGIFRKGEIGVLVAFGAGLIPKWSATFLVRFNSDRFLC